MAFDTSTFTDNFTRADGALGANWTNKVIDSDNANIVILSNRCRSNSGSNNSVWYSAAQLGAHCEVQAELQVVPTGTDQVGVFARLQNPGTSTVSGYLVSVDGTTIYIYILYQGSYELLTETPFVVANNDEIGIYCRNKTIQAWVKDGAAAWASLLSVEDPWIEPGGYSGFYIDGTVARVDNFIGATISESASTTKKRRMLLGVG